MQIIPQPLPRIHLRRLQPRFPIRQRQKVPPAGNYHGHDPRRRGPERQERVPTHAIPGREVSFGEAGGDSATSPTAALLDAPVFFAVAGRGGEGGDGVVEGDGVEVEDEFEEGAGDEGGGEVGGEVVVQEELAAHEVEGEVMRGPAEEEESGGVVEAGACTYINITDVNDLLGERGGDSWGSR